VENIDVAILFTVILAFFIFVIFLIPMSAIFALDNFKSNEIKKNDPPVIVTLHKVRANAGQLVTLDASKSIDPDRDPIKFRWEKVSADNLSIDLMNDHSSIASFVAPQIKSQTTMVFRLSVVDINGNTDSDQIQVIISKKTGKDKQEGQTLIGKPKLDNKEDKIDKSQGKLLGSSSVNKKQNTLTKSELKQGLLSDESRKDSRVAGNQIKVNAGSDTEAFGGEIVTLGGEISSDLNSNQIKLSWKQTNGPRVQLSSNHIFNPLFVAPNVKKSEKIEFELYASDQHGVVASDSVTIVVNPPSGKEGQISDKEGQNTRPNKVESDNASTKTTTTSAFQITTSSLYDNFQGSTYALKDGMTSPNGKWLDKWNGYGQAGVKTVSGYNVFYQIPKASTRSSETHSGLVVSKQKFSDITLDIDMKTYKQTRLNSPPNSWEAAWVMWRWVDLYHHYYFVIKTNGIEFGKKDTSCNCEKQIFLKTGPSPKLQVGAWNHIKISSIGKHTTIWVGGVKVVDMDDPSYNSAKMSSGFIGLYTEDASVGFDNVYIGK
jgi:hypothetical protein